MFPFGLLSNLNVLLLQVYGAVAGSIAWYLSYLLPYIYIPYTAFDPAQLITDEVIYIFAYRKGLNFCLNFTI